LRQDPVIQQHREHIAALDLKILEALNQRIHLVKQLKGHKEAQGLSFHDPAQEARVLTTLCQANPGPLSEEGLRAIFTLILAWAKHDAARAE
jgi:chorismate mutase/prephenate dehydratase